MRKLSLVAGALMLVGASSPDLPNFEFKGVVAGTPVDPKKLRGCEKEGAARTCRSLSGEIAGNEVAFITYEYVDGKLSSLTSMLAHSAFPSVFDAFKAKYGEPCSQRIAVWQNAAGAKFDNPTYEWCFRSGKLTMQSYGPRITSMALIYMDDNQPPKSSPTVDF